MSVKQIHLREVTWLTTDIKRLMSCLSITHLDGLCVGPTCQLRCSLSPASPSSLFKVREVNIHASMSINTLTSLISNIEVIMLSLESGCQVLDMDVNTIPQVSQGHLYQTANMSNVNPLNAGDAFKRIHTVFPQLKFDRN